MRCVYSESRCGLIFELALRLLPVSEGMRL